MPHCTHHNKRASITLVADDIEVLRYRIWGKCVTLKDLFSGE